MTAESFTQEQSVFYRYLERRLKAGEVGSRLSMGAVFVARNKLDELLVAAAATDQETVPVTPEMQALCDLLYIDLEQYKLGGEDAKV